MSQELRTVWWEPGAVCLIDQLRLPHEEVTVRCTELAAVAAAIKTMVVRGAPAIGCTAAYGIALVATQSTATDAPALLRELEAAKATLDAQRPTAVNLAWATTRMLNQARALAPSGLEALRTGMLEEAHAVLHEDLAMCHAIGDYGAPLIPERGHVLTHCNAGGLATAGYGTALAPMRTAASQGRTLHVWVDETRPFLQGARLTAWELREAGIPLTLITDNMAGYMMQSGEVDCIIVGADRIVANGDVANKIGTYSLAVLANFHNIPFYVAAPSSTIDLSLATGDLIPIEQRSSDEVTHLGGQLIAPLGVNAAHPAFDVTPNRLITAIITERGVVYPPFTEGLSTAVRRS
ncbi:S-methyl-5-thioribose-1-phosphate isomerase [Candidatus Viridilinea mediisalina]|uniref:Methylthioribose-1-phosphate isomerase n=1 Tax=Candidatus Viridilinea mediisalina TaxID=2024553 RepID=A0A2A6RKZ5_9CHLR|nr:S-methyl-5-thioribose-1-phosphate isomerase [Candidatus Viridilinea mediisalina]PDW03549.1 S-methyl-5-thioribose-1-phosphate isomerase [Candidatus Viridilinea mediisalina]